MSDAPPVLWSPSADAAERTRMGAYLHWLASERGLVLDGYDELWRWSVDDLDAFWSSLWEYFDVRSTEPYTRALTSRQLPGARWFEGASISYAEHMLRAGDDDELALVATSQTRPTVQMSRGELRAAVARVRGALRELGVGRGDRVAAYLPNIPETIVAFLATAGIGAVWSSCAPEFGVRSVIDRFSQIEPTVLLAVDGYRYGSRDVDRAAEIEAIRAALPSLRATVLVPYLYPDAPPAEDVVPWSALTSAEPDPTCVPVPFDHPLYVLYSSGTTGLPKPIVHGHGGILIEHLKTLALHKDLGPGDRFFWFTTTGWMMWNYLVSGLGVGAALVLFDGDPGSPDLNALWRMAAETGTTYFGTSAPYLLACRKAGIHPRAAGDLTRVRGVGSTGAPLPPEGFRWVYDELGPDIHLSSVSGGTDVCTAFVGGSPLVPVWEGEISCRCLGAAVAAVDDEGKELVGRQGELVVTAPLPSMPVGLWNDPDGSRFRATYFEEHPGMWSHGDWITVTERGSCIISGRSDATLNRGGVRLGTSEFYSVVESLAEVADSLVVHLEDPSGGPGELLLFVVPAAGENVDDALRGRITSLLRTELSPRHVPDAIHAVPAVPRTLSGKKLEVPVKRILLGMPADQAASRGALTDPSALEPFEQLAAARASTH